MNTTDIMNIALDLAGFDDIPGDSEIFHPCGKVGKVLFGIDIWDEDMFRSKKLGVNLVISHHPPNLTPGKRFSEVIASMVEIMVSAGVPLNVAKEAIVPIKAEYAFNPHRDHHEITALARELDIGLMNIHQPCDEVGRRILQSVIDGLDRQRPVSALMAKFNHIPEIASSGASVELVCGDKQNSIGTAVVIHGAGTNGGYPVADALFSYGVNTVVYIHLLPHQRADRERLVKENKGNLIVTGHYPSDAIGINPFIKELEKRGIEVIRCNNL